VKMGRKVKIRSFIIGAFFTLFFIGVSTKLYWVQIVEGASLRGKAESLWSQEVVLQPVRGSIVDRNGQVLAQDGDAYTVAVNPRLIAEYKQENAVVAMLAPLLSMDTPAGQLKLREKIAARNKDGRLLAQVEIRNEGWKIDKSLADQIREARDTLGLRGIYLIEQSKRYYPADQLAAQLLGYTDKENEARSGLELMYDDLLKGTPGKLMYEKDARGVELPDGKASLIQPLDGKNLVLTIDRNIQHYMEEALVEMNEKFQPKAAMAIAVDPNTMEILGMSSLPTYNPNSYWDYAEKADFAMNRTISSQYEPGSTFKIVTLAAAVDQGLFHAEDTYMSGSVNVAGTPMGDHNNRRGWGEITYLDGLKRSSNVAFIKLGYEGLGAEKLKSYIEKFGFGQKTGIDLPGEVSGKIDFRYPTEVAAATFGQGVSVTPIQQIAAVSAIANGGKLMKPYLVKEIHDAETGKLISKTEPEVVREVLAESKARLVSDYLEQVVSDQKIGTGRRVYIDGYRIAGKTGTAQKVVDGKYAPDKWVVSFIGYAPADDPKIALLVIVDDPDIGGDSLRSSEVAAPVFKDVMGKALRYYGVGKENTSVGVTQWKDIQAVTMPDLVGQDVSDAGKTLGRYGMSYERLGIGKTILKQYPNSGDQVAAEQQVYLLTDSSEKIVFPDLRDRPMRDVLEVCALVGQACGFQGEGYVASQTEDHTTQPSTMRFVFQTVTEKLHDTEKTNSGEALEKVDASDSMQEDGAALTTGQEEKSEEG
jgi:penicillin-binding protein 2B